MPVTAFGCGRMDDRPTMSIVSGPIPIRGDASSAGWATAAPHRPSTGRDAQSIGSTLTSKTGSRGHRASDASPGKHPPQRPVSSLPSGRQRGIFSSRPRTIRTSCAPSPVRTPFHTRLWRRQPRCSSVKSPARPWPGAPSLPHDPSRSRGFAHLAPSVRSHPTVYIHDAHPLVRSTHAGPGTGRPCPASLSATGVHDWRPGVRSCHATATTKGRLPTQ